MQMHCKLLNVAGPLAKMDEQQKKNSEPENAKY
jgi:hypothetical protein